MPTPTTDPAARNIESATSRDTLLEIYVFFEQKAAYEIIRGISLSVDEGEVHVLMGPNGSGKSTLAKALLANPAYDVTSGSIRFRGDDITKLPTHERAA